MAYFSLSTRQFSQSRSRFIYANFTDWCFFQISVIFSSKITVKIRFTTLIYSKSFLSVIFIFMQPFLIVLNLMFCACFSWIFTPFRIFYNFSFLFSWNILTFANCHVLKSMINYMIYLLPFIANVWIKMKRGVKHVFL